MEDIFDKLNGVLGITKYSNSEVITPEWVVTDMVDLLAKEDKTIFSPDRKFLDPAVKSGRFLVELYQRLMVSELMVQAFPDEQDRKIHILEHQLYGVATSPVAATIVRKQLYGNPQIAGNIVYTADKVTKELIQGAFENMKFDVVIGNPPYNNDIYLDFVTLGHNLASKYTCMITPAKWQTKGGNKNEKFRKDIVPYMSKVVFYLDAGDIFDIREMDGIAYYIIGHAKQDNKIIVNKCNRNANFNNVTERKLLSADSLNNVGHAINIKLSTCKKYSFKNRKGQKYMVSLIDAMNFPGKRIVDMQGKTLMFPPMHISEMLIGNESCVFSSDSKSECESFISWVEAKLVKFLVLINTIGYHGLFDDLHFKYVPDPGAFDHIFTNQESYQEYGLTQEEIDIIESVIKERK